jgi:hypothetical protein
MHPPVAEDNISIYATQALKLIEPTGLWHKKADVSL